MQSARATADLIGLWLAVAAAATCVGYAVDSARNFYLSRRHRRRPAAVHFVSPFTGELLTWWVCGVHGGEGLGTPDHAPGHCRAAWGDDPRECDGWVPALDEHAAGLTQEAVR